MVLAVEASVRHRVRGRSPDPIQPRASGPRLYRCAWSTTARDCGPRGAGRPGRSTQHEGDRRARPSPATNPNAPRSPKHHRGQRLPDDVVDRQLPVSQPLKKLSTRGRTRPRGSVSIDHQSGTDDTDGQIGPRPSHGDNPRPLQEFARRPYWPSSPKTRRTQDQHGDSAGLQHLAISGKTGHDFDDHQTKVVARGRAEASAGAPRARERKRRRSPWNV